jgi:quinol monooxygenase YgiN
VVQVLVRLVASPARANDILSAFRTLMRAANHERGCSFAQVYQWPNDPQHIEYIEEWDDASELRRQFGTERFLRLLELLERSTDPPLLEFRFISETHGLDYIAGSQGEIDAPK